MNEVGKLPSDISTDSGVESMTSSKESLVEGCQSDDSGLGSPTSGEEEANKDMKDVPMPTRSSTRIRQARNYDLRESSLINRIQTERRRAEPRQPKPKAKAPPLSKYRRRSANARERCRMKSINEAFDDLRQVIPELPTATLAPGTKVPTKITTLRLAMNYIAALRDMLGYDAIVMPSVLPPLATGGPNEDNQELGALREDLAHLGRLPTPSSQPVQPVSSPHNNPADRTVVLDSGRISSMKASLTLPVNHEVLHLPAKGGGNGIQDTPGSRGYCQDKQSVQLPADLESVKMINTACNVIQTTLAASLQHSNQFFMDCTALTPELDIAPTSFDDDVTSGTLDADLAVSHLDLHSFLDSPTSSLSSHPSSMDSESELFLT